MQVPVSGVQAGVMIVGFITWRLYAHCSAHGNDGWVNYTILQISRGAIVVHPGGSGELPQPSLSLCMVSRCGAGGLPVHSLMRAGWSE